VRNAGHAEAVVPGLDHGEAAAVDGDRPLLDDVAGQPGGHPDRQIGSRADDLPDTVDVTLHDVAAEPVAGPDRALEVHRVTGPQLAERAAGERLVDDVGRVPPGPDVDDGEAAAVVGDGVTHLGVLQDDAGLDHETVAVALTEPSQLLDYAGEHSSSTRRSSPS